MEFASAGCTFEPLAQLLILTNPEFGYIDLSTPIVASGVKLINLEGNHGDLGWAELLFFGCETGPIDELSPGMKKSFPLGMYPKYHSTSKQQTKAEMFMIFFHQTEKRHTYT